MTYAAKALRRWYLENGFPHAAAAAEDILREHKGNVAALMGQIAYALFVLSYLPKKLRGRFVELEPLR